MAVWGNHYRHLVLLVGFLCLSSVCSNYIVINFTFICMKHDFSETFDISNGTVKSIYDYTPDQQKWIMWAVAAGTIIGTIPINWFYVKFGAKTPFLIAGITSLISTALIPFAAKYSMTLLLVLRFIQGLAYSADFAAIGLMTVRWAPLRETAFFIATLTCFTGIASMITNSVTGVICQSSLGWKWAFYLHSIAGAILFFLWAIIYVEDPQDSKRISDKELTKIHKNKSAAHLDKTTTVPYMKLLTSPVILVIWLNAFFEMSAVILFATYMPIYFHEVLGFGVAETGFYVGMLLGMNIPLRLVAAMVSDRMTIISERLKIAIYNTISVGISGLLMAAIGFFPKENRFECAILIMVCMLCIALNCGGFYKCGALHARQFAHVVIAAVQFMKCLALFTAPGLVAFFVHENSNREHWIPVFITLGASMFVANFISLFVFTDEPAEWTLCETEKKYEKVAMEEVAKN